MAARWLEDEDDSEPWAELYEEIERLPEKCREPIVLCYLAGCTQEEALRSSSGVPSGRFRTGSLAAATSCGSA